MPGRNGEQIAARWVEALERSTEPRLIARELYCGDHWETVRSIADGPQRSVWVASAGYGLFPVEAAITPYGATFSKGHPDAVFRDNDGSLAVARAWWRRLSSWKGPSPGSSRTVHDLARRSRRSPLLVVAAPPYVRAMVDDLLAAAEELSDPDLLIIVTSRSFLPARLQRHVVLSEERLRRRVNGSCVSLNARLALDALDRFPAHELRSGPLRDHYARLAARQEASMPTGRAPMSDDEVRAFIKKSLAANPKARHSPLLRQLRDSGRACEQARFRKLFHEVTGGSDGR